MSPPRKLQKKANSYCCEQIKAKARMNERSNGVLNALDDILP